jgi:hypothetical protein
MSNWLVPLKRAFTGHGVIDIASQNSGDLRRVISEGTDIVLRYRRNPVMPEFHHREPIAGVAVVRDVRNLELYLASIVAESVRRTRWEHHQFYYPCLDTPRIMHTSPWRSLSQGTANHGIEPMLTYEKDVWVFEGRDWLLCEVKLCLA